MRSIQDQLYEDSVKNMASFLQRIRNKRKERNMNDLVNSMESCVIIENADGKVSEEAFTTRNADIEASISTENKERIKEMWSSVFGNVTIVNGNIIPDRPVPLDIGAIKMLRKKEEYLARSIAEDDYVKEKSCGRIQVAHNCKDSQLQPIKLPEVSKSLTGDDRVEKRTCARRQVVHYRRNKRLLVIKQPQASSSSGGRVRVKVISSRVRRPVSHNRRKNQLPPGKLYEVSNPRVKLIGSRVRRPVSPNHRKNQLQPGISEASRSRGEDRLKERTCVRIEAAHHRRNDQLKMNRETEKESQALGCDAKS